MLLEADQYSEAARQPSGVDEESDPKGKRVAKKWLEGMARGLRERFPRELRRVREVLGFTQVSLAEHAGLTVTSVAMIERSERAPSLDTAARLCWAIDIMSGLRPEDLK